MARSAGRHGRQPIAARVARLQDADLGAVGGRGERTARNREMHIDAAAGRQNAVLGEGLLDGGVDLAPQDELPPGRP